MTALAYRVVLAATALVVALVGTGCGGDSSFEGRAASAQGGPATSANPDASYTSTSTPTSSSTTTTSSPPSTTTTVLIPGGPGRPEIRLTSVPGRGSEDNLFGQVLHVVPADYQVATYIRVGSGWWTKPYWATPTVAPNAAGEFEVDVTTGGIDTEADRIVVYLVPKGYNPPQAQGGPVPATVDANSLAKAEANRPRPPGLAPGGAIPGGPGTPEVTLTSVPALGSSDNLYGQVLHVDPAEYRVATFIRVGSGWWTKPYWATPTVALKATGEFEVDVTTGGIDPQANRMVVFLVPRGYDPPLASGEGSIPAGVAANAVATAEVRR